MEFTVLLCSGAVTGALVGLIVRGSGPGLVATLLPDLLLGVTGALSAAALITTIGLGAGSSASPETSVVLMGAVIGALLLTSLVHALPRTWAL